MRKAVRAGSLGITAGNPVRVPPWRPFAVIMAWWPGTVMTGQKAATGV